MILPSGAYCAIRAKYVSYTKDEPHPEHGYCAVTAPLQPGDHHWVTLIAEYWDSEADFLAKKPSVLIVDVHFGHRHVIQFTDTLDAEITRILDSHYTGGRRGNFLNANRAPKVDDALGLLNHPHVAALEVTNL